VRPCYHFLENCSSLVADPWQLSTVGDGYIKVSEPRRYELQPSVHLHDWDPRIKSDDPTAEVYSVAVAHQLHCLVRMNETSHAHVRMFSRLTSRQALLRVKLLTLAQVTAEGAGAGDHNHKDVSHLVHCLDYRKLAPESHGYAVLMLNLFLIYHVLSTPKYHLLWRHYS